MTSNQETPNIECSQPELHQMLLATRDKLKESMNVLDTLGTKLAESESRDHEQKLRDRLHDRVHELRTELIHKIADEKDEKVLRKIGELVSGEVYEAPDHFSTEPPILQSLEDRIEHRFGKNPVQYEGKLGAIGKKMAPLFRKMNQEKDPEKRPHLGHRHRFTICVYPAKYWEFMDHFIASDLGLEADVKLSRGYLQHLYKVDCLEDLIPTKDTESHRKTK